MGDDETENKKEANMLVWMQSIQKAICPVVCTKCKLVSETVEMIDKQCRIYEGMRVEIREQMDMLKAARPMRLAVKIICAECSHTGYIEIANPLKRKNNVS